MSFLDVLEKYDWEEVLARVDSISDRQVEQALSRAGRGSLDDFLALVSPRAGHYLEQMGQVSYDLTRKRFGNNINLFTPIYLSNECNNVCTYCGFSFTNKITRKTLNHEQMLAEIETIKSEGFDSILLLTGENSKNVGVSYLNDALKLFKKHFTYVALEVQPLDAEEYGLLIQSGLDAVLVYQETYHRPNYAIFHPRGKKSKFDYRLLTPERAGSVGIRKLGLGVLLGLSDWRVDSFMCAAHLDFLKKKFWQTQFSISFPRFRPASNVNSKYNNVGEKDLLQVMLAFRIFDEDLDLSLSTREAPSYRDQVFPYGVTTISAGSKTNPGGYSCEEESLEQFATSDKRTPHEVASKLTELNLFPVWKDWDKTF